MTSPGRLSGHLVRIAAVAAISLAGIGVAAAPAQAAVTGFGGPVGVQQTVTVSGTSPSLLGEATCTVVPTINGVAQLPATGALFNGTLIFLWTPQTVGAATFSLADCSTTSTIPAASITQVGTTTTIATPNTSAVGQPIQINVVVQSTSPSAYAPTGQVVVRNANGAVLQTMGLTPGPGTGQSYAYFRWTPTQAGTFFFQATYSGDSNATTSTSPQDTVIVTPSGNTISLTGPATMTQGVPVTLVATVAPSGVQGSVGFTANGTPISASVPLVRGVATFLWTPNVVGVVTVGANYMTNQGGSGSTTERVTVVPGPVAKDVITLVQPGVGVWGPNASFQIPNGSTFTFQASTLSGAGVTLTETGACQVSGLTLVVDTGNAQCNLTASSPGGNGYAPVQQGYTVITIPGNQTATLAAPNSGSFNKGRTIRLQNPSQGQTNAGRNISWRVTSGSNRCRIAYPSSGAVNLRLNKTGRCEVQARAPGVSGQWKPFRLERAYRIR